MYYPRFERRVRAFAIDTSGAIIFVLIGMLGLKGHLILQYLVAGAGFFGFYFLPYFISSGQSLGKRVEGIRIVNSNNSLMNIFKSLLRQTTLLVFSILTGGIYLIVVFFSINEKKGQSIHDKIFKTKVIDLRIPIKEEKDDGFNKTDSMRKKGF